MARNATAPSVVTGLACNGKPELTNHPIAQCVGGHTADTAITACVPP